MVYISISLYILKCLDCMMEIKYIPITWYLPRVVSPNTCSCNCQHLFVAGRNAYWPIWLMWCIAGQYLSYNIAVCFQYTSERSVCILGSFYEVLIRSLVVMVTALHSNGILYIGAPELKILEGNGLCVHVQSLLSLNNSTIQAGSRHDCEQ